MNNYERKALDYLKEKEPKKLAELKKAGKLKEYLATRAEEALNAKNQMVEKAGMRDFEAEEIAREMLRE